MNALFGPRAAVMVAAVAVLCLGGAVAGEPPDVRVADFAGKILAHDEEGFDFRLDETGDVVRLRWADLAPGEVDRVRRAVVKLAAERQPAAGPLVDAVRVTLRTSKILTGIEVPELSTRRELCISTLDVKEAKIPRRLIRRSERVRVPETEVRPRAEIHRRKLASAPPRTAKEHYDLALWCRRMDLYEEAIDHLERCGALDTRYPPRTRLLMAELKASAEEAAARKLYGEVTSSMVAGRCADALAALGKLKAFHPEAECTTKALAFEADLKARHERSLRRKVITSWYAGFDEALRAYVYGGVAEAGVWEELIRLKAGNSVLIGRVKEETDTEVVLWNRATQAETRIAKEAMHSRHKRLRKARRTRAPTFAEAKSHATDPAGGISLVVAGKVAKACGVTEERAREIWKERLDRKFEVEADGTVSRRQLFYSLRQADYGPGSWLRQGAGVSVAAGAQGAARPDPEAWWKKQTAEMRLMVLRAFCYEALLDVVRVDAKKCSGCGGKGYSAVVGALGASAADLCSRCHGTGLDYRLSCR